VASVVARDGLDGHRLGGERVVVVEEEAVVGEALQDRRLVEEKAATGNEMRVARQKRGRTASSKPMLIFSGTASLNAPGGSTLRA